MTKETGLLLMQAARKWLGEAYSSEGLWSHTEPMEAAKAIDEFLEAALAASKREGGA